MNHSRQLEKFCKVYDDQVNNEMQVKAAMQAVDRAMHVRKKLLTSIESLSKSFEMRSAMHGQHNQKQAKARIRGYNRSYPHRDKLMIESLVSKELSTSTANRIETIMTSKWFERPENYKLMSSLTASKNDRLKIILGSRN